MPILQQLSQELDLWKRVSSHPNVAPFLGVMSGFGPLPSLVQPFYKNGNINDYLGKHLDADSLYMLSCVADALDFMHNLSPPVAHGGIRGTNILISDTGVPQLSDVSVCNMPHSSDLTYMSGEFLSTRWMAPEVIDPPPGSEPSTSPCGLETGYETPQSDVYSFGMTILEILTGRHPFAHRRMHTGVIIDVVRGIRPPRPECAKMTDSLWDIVQSCWKQDPKERPGMGTVKSWLRLVSLMPRDERKSGMSEGDGA
ncbi:kinase-like domain-containing protein [Collybia nuda]|uniref:Kinase-like domain-containing protein n=1 Tax=Collybia nuda TaxID=64659 RepID=A0A9P5XVJ5_9AGAR|nr:kinase-like domain-containing protein [Collybia nuda]